jgi:dolichol-phosphate mannosyltransferase
VSGATTTSRSTSATDILVVIPTYNERENLPGLGAAVLALGPAYRIIVVDDNSPDGTGQLADDLARAHPGRVAVMHQPAKTGLGLAYVAGFGHALKDGAGLIVSMDADYSHAPADLLRLVAAAADHDLVIGSRYVRGGRTIGWPLRRRLLSRLGGLYARAVLGVRIADLTSGFKVYRRATLAAIDLAGVHAGGYGFNIEVTYRALRNGARVVEVPISFAERAAGLSKISWPIILEAAVVVAARWRPP